MKNLQRFLIKTYGEDKEILEFQTKRFEKLIEKFYTKFDETRQLAFFSVPGRTELGGNHTDHGNGKVLAASINLDTIAVASPNASDEIKVFSEEFDKPFSVNVNALEKIETENGTSDALIRGILKAFANSGYSFGGFNAYVSSSIPIGVGLSSSAAFEVLIATILNRFYNKNFISLTEIAKAAAFAENEYFDKPCGLMDQLACAYGGIISIDFSDAQNPEIERLNFNFEKYGYKLLLVNTGGSHANLTEDYAAIPREMKTVAKALRKQTVREIDKDEFLANIKNLRAKVGDRAILRVLHFLNENKRVSEQVEYLKNGEINNYLASVRASGDSSFKLLQNVISGSNEIQQGVALALALTNEFFTQNNIQGACRVHGGGFAGTIQTYLPKSYAKNYAEFMETVFGKSCVYEISIRSVGAVSS